MPGTAEQQRPPVMAFYELLPETNCRVCNQPACWNLALRLAAAQVELAASTPLHEPAHAECRAAWRRCPCPCRPSV